MTGAKAVWRRVAPVLWLLAIGWLTFDPLVTEIGVERHTWTIDATVTSYDDNAKLRLVGEAGTVDVYFTPGEREATATVTQYGFADVPRTGDTIRIDYDTYHPSRARRAGDHGGLVAAGVRFAVLVASLVYIARRWRARPAESA